MSRHTGCRHALQLREGSSLKCMSCGTPLNADTGRSLARVNIQPVIGQRAAEPISTDDTLRSLGYTPLPHTRSTRIPSYMNTPYRRSGGKRNAYCPVYD